MNHHHHHWLILISNQLFTLERHRLALALVILLPPYSPSPSITIRWKLKRNCESNPIRIDTGYYWINCTSCPLETGIDRPIKLWKCSQRSPLVSREEDERLPHPSLFHSDKSSRPTVAQAEEWKIQLTQTDFSSIFINSPVSNNSGTERSTLSHRQENIRTWK